MNLMELFVKIGVDDQASSKINDINGKVGGGLKKAANIGVKAITVASTAIVGLTGLAIKNYAEYEQLVGGVQTLFGESSDKLMEYANNAYMTAGISANDYMNIATSFSASLLSSLKGDTEAATEYTNMAIQDMSDNANKMGTDIESIQYAYQGFAKQNFTMLDNLKLGYGGTKSEMERLLADAEKITGIHYDINNLSDIIAAIHVIQTEIGITGTTMDEAQKTITGSIMMTKAAWTNLITGMADDEADIEKLIDNFIESAGYALKNLIPRVGVALEGMGKVIEELLPVVLEMIPSLITETLPNLLDSAGQIVLTLANGIRDSLPTLLETAITDTLPNLLDSAGKVVLTLANGILDSLPTLLETALEIVVALANGIALALPELTPKIVGVVLKIVEILTNPDTITQLLSAAYTIIIALADGLMQALPELIAKAPVIVKNLVKGIISQAPLLKTAALQLITTLVSGIAQNVKKIFNAGKDAGVKFGNGIQDKIANIFSKGKSLGLRALSGIKSGIGNVASIGQNLVEGLWNGVANKVDWVTKKMASFGKKVIKSLKDFFGIKSPSTLMRDEVGRFLAEGVAVGFIENDPMSEIEASLNNSVRSMNVPSVGMYGRGGSFGSSEVSIIQNIYSQAQTAADLMQEAIYQQEKAVYLGV